MVVGMLVAGLAIGTMTHALHLVNVGGVVFDAAPTWMNVYWATLTALDPLVAVLLLYRRPIGLMLGTAIIVSDVAINSYALYGMTDVDLASERARIYASHDGRLDPPGRIDDLTREGSAKLLIWGEDGWKEGPVFPLETPHPLLGRFADGRWLVVGSRTRGDPNARVFSPNGSLLTRFMPGDGIKHVAIDELDRI